MFSVGINSASSRRRLPVLKAVRKAKLSVHVVLAKPACFGGVLMLAHVGPPLGLSKVAVSPILQAAVVLVFPLQQ